jgi:hypothetical protein
MAAILSMHEACSHPLPADLDYPDVYFTPGYGASAALMERGEWEFAHCEEKIMLPYVRRCVDVDTCDAVSPYGYSGVYVSPDCPPDDVARFWLRILEWWRERGIVTMFLRFSPMDRASLAAVSKLGSIDLVRRGDTILIPVGSRAESLWSGLESRARNTIRKAERAGLAGRMRLARDGDLASGSPFRTLYEATMRRVGSAPMYFFDDDYYAALARGVGPGLRIAEVHGAGGAVEASALVLTHGDRVHYHLAASTPDGARQGANNLLIWTILTWADEHGKRLVHLGGGVSTGDSLFTFKRSFGGQRAEFWTGAVVVDPDRYGQLVRSHAAKLGMSAAELQRSTYFPRYRAPVH